MLHLADIIPSCIHGGHPPDCIRKPKFSDKSALIIKNTKKDDKYKYYYWELIMS